MLLEYLFAGLAIVVLGQDTFTNPILSGQAADPWVIRHDGWYYLTLSGGDKINLLRSKILTYVP